jgi:S-adenosylmethionine hydrolase
MERGNPARPPRCVVLLTDFGLADPYVGQMRGILARLAPGAPVLDLTHGVAPFNLAQAGYFLAASAPHFPEDAVFTAVVDPGVGTARRIVAVERRRQIFLAPDNGLLDLVLQGGEALRVFDLTPDAITLGRASATFQGRDVFAPLAARLALGEPPSALGTAMDPAGLVRSPWGRPEPEEGGVAAQVLHVDRFGNCVLNLRQDFALPPGEVRLAAPKTVALRRARTYADLTEGQTGLLLGSQGFLELARFMGSAAGELGLEPGAAVRLAWGAA